MKLPSLVEIEINSYCNLACSYCPNSTEQRIEKGDMDPKLFLKILQQLAEYNYQGRLAFEFYNEPLLSKNILSFIPLVKEILPKTTLILYSNGTKIDSKGKLNELSQLGVDLFVITKHEDIEEYPFEKVYNSLTDQEKTHITYKEHKDIKKYNRGGLLPHIENSQSVIHKPCGLPENVLTVTVKGNVLSCFEDFRQKYEFGNAHDKNIIEIWNGQQYDQFRTDLKAGKRSLYETCAQCNRTDKIMKNTNKHLIDDQEFQAVKNVLESGQLFRYQQGMGECDQFEIEFSHYIGTKHALTLTSGTNALIAALTVLGIGHGDEVIIPSYTYFATASAVLNTGAIPVVVNISSNLLISLNEIKQAITEQTKAIIPVHMDGYPCDIESIVDIAKENNLYVIEDVAQALGASVKGRKLGSFGDIGCFSFNRDKTITCGEGGAITTNNETLIEKLRCLSDQAFEFNPNIKTAINNIDPFLASSMRVSEITGALLRVQLTKADLIIKENENRKKIIHHILQTSPLYNIKFFLPEPIDHQGEIFSTYHIQLATPDQSADLSKQFLAHNLMIIPTSLRLAHSVWKWGHYLKEGMTLDPRRDPFLNTKSNYKFVKINYVESLNILASTLRGEIDIKKSLDEIESEALLIRTLIEDYFNEN